MRSCLPHLQDSAVTAAVEEYYGIKEDYADLEKVHGVLALRLGDFSPSPFRPLSRTEISSLGNILKPRKCLQYLTKIASGSFAHVYKFKRYDGSPHSPSCSSHSPSSCSPHSPSSCSPHPPSSGSPHSPSSCSPHSPPPARLTSPPPSSCSPHSPSCSPHLTYYYVLYRFMSGNGGSK